MMRFAVLFALVFSVALLSIYAEPIEVEEVTLVATHRVYKNFREVHTVKMGERFILSDTEFSAEAVEFIPDFAIKVKSKEIISRSDEPNNPAVRVVVYQNDEKVDEVWAFQGKGAPHFYRDSFLAFELLDYRVKATSSPQSPGETGLQKNTQLNGDESVDNGGDSEN